MEYVKKYLMAGLFIYLFAGMFFLEEYHRQNEEKRTGAADYHRYESGPRFTPTMRALIWPYYAFASDAVRKGIDEYLAACEKSLFGQ